MDECKDENNIRLDINYTGDILANLNQIPELFLGCLQPILDLYVKTGLCYPSVAYNNSLLPQVSTTRVLISISFTLIVHK